MRPNVLLISIDTLRADRLGCYGYERDTSPALDRFAAERAVRFAAAVAESPWTVPSHVTLLSGLHPISHGVRLPDLAPGPDVPLLAELLTDAGYSTVALTDGGWLSEAWGFDRGFQRFQALDQDFDATVDQALAFVEERSAVEGPWFAFLHTYDVHCPYDPPAPFAERFQGPGAEPIEVAGKCGNPHYNGMELTAGQIQTLSDHYDGGVAWVDQALGRLLSRLAEAGALENTVVVVTSDHGEELGEHGSIGHERTLSALSLAIPLLIAVPGGVAGVSEGPASLADVVPTLLELCSVPAPEGLDGVSLVPRLAGDPAPAEAGRLSELAWQTSLVSWNDGAHHLVLDPREAGVPRLSGARGPDSEADDGHVRDLTRRIETLRAALERGARRPIPAGGLSEAQLERLRALGY